MPLWEFSLGSSTEVEPIASAVGFIFILIAMLYNIKKPSLRDKLLEKHQEGEEKPEEQTERSVTKKKKK